MIDVSVLRHLIQTTLEPLLLYSSAAEELLLATCAQESHMGYYRRQVGGPALGIFQMEPASFHDICVNYLQYHPILDSKINVLGPRAPDELVNNDALAIAMARVQYLRAPEPLPYPTDLKAIWTLYKLRWNTPQGAATIEQFYRNYKTLVHGDAA
jgi:hypothetical protein